MASPLARELGREALFQITSSQALGFILLKWNVPWQYLQLFRNLTFWKGFTPVLQNQPYKTSPINLGNLSLAASRTGLMEDRLYQCCLVGICQLLCLVACSHVALLSLHSTPTSRTWDGFRKKAVRIRPHCVRVVCRSAAAAPGLHIFRRSPEANRI